MGVEFLSKALRELILYNDRISLPELGSFVVEIVPSVFSDGGLVIHPPAKRVLFRVSEIWDDEILEKRYAEEENISLQESKERFKTFANSLRSQLHSKKSYVIPGFGTLRATDKKNYFFVADKELFICMESFGLEPLNIKVLQKPGVIEQLEQGPCSGMSEMEKVGISSIDTGKILEIDYDNIKTDSAAPYIGTIIENRGDKTSKTEPASNLKKGVTPKKKGSSKVLLTILIILGVLLLVILILVVFKEEFRPFWEWLLYSKGEREILNL
jgi:hypothetical protein